MIEVRINTALTLTKIIKDSKDREIETIELGNFFKSIKYLRKNFSKKDRDLKYLLDYLEKSAYDINTPILQLINKNKFKNIKNSISLEIALTEKEILRELSYQDVLKEFVVEPITILQNYIAFAEYLKLNYASIDLIYNNLLKIKNIDKVLDLEWIYIVMFKKALSQPCTVNSQNIILSDGQIKFIYNNDFDEIEEGQYNCSFQNANYLLHYCSNKNSNRNLLYISDLTFDSKTFPKDEKELKEKIAQFKIPYDFYETTKKQIEKCNKQLTALEQDKAQFQEMKERLKDDLTSSEQETYMLADIAIFKIEEQANNIYQETLDKTKLSKESLDHELKYVRQKTC